MRLIPREVHAALDFAFGAVLIALPWVANFSGAQQLTGVCVGTGAAVLLLALVTDTRVALVRIVPMHVHLLVDAIVSCFLVGLAVGLALNGGGGRMWAPLLGLGIAGFLVTATTDASRPRATRSADRERPASGERRRAAPVAGA